MSLFVKTECGSESAAVAAFHATDGVFDDIEEAESYGLKRNGASLLWRLDGPGPTVERMIDALRRSGRFMRIEKMQESEFWSARSHSV